MKHLLYTLALTVIFIISSCTDKDQTPVEKFGQLKIEGTNITDQKSKAVQITGMSLFWSQWIGQYYNYDCIKWLRDDWKCMVVRAAIAVDHGGYAENPEREMSRAKKVIDAAIDLGVYVIVDFHSHHAEDYQDEAKTFFSELASEYGDYPNIIYEIYNEPLNVSWNDVLKPYSETIIAEIRKHDPNNIIVCGTPRWSQQVDEAALNPIDDDNVAYTLHFYAGTHDEELMQVANNAIKKGLCIFVTEYGTTNANGGGPVFKEETKKWYNWMDKHQISHCNWSIADKNESSAALVEGASANGSWKEDEIKTSGKFVREELRKKHSAIFK
ncbi:MAG: glycoside hydrolase family 5 protein [Prolixibacteraceae bacterium]|jgi:endoglucanase|nr:glycoside hydrolase family 5 protein [Prolixibacteraceae bacterium]